jgi:hypothetical protein
MRADAAAELDALPRLLDRVWTASLPARSRFALSLCTNRLALSRRARLEGGR